MAEIIKINEQNRFKSHVDPAIYGIFRRIYWLARKKDFPVECSGFTCSGHVYEEGISEEQKKEYKSLATGKFEKIYPLAYMYLLYRTKGIMYNKAIEMHNLIISINKNKENKLYKVVVESYNPSSQFPPKEKDIAAFEKGHDFILVRYELIFTAKPGNDKSALMPAEAREAFRHFWQCFSDIIYLYEKKYSEKGVLGFFSSQFSLHPLHLPEREIINPKYFSYRGLGEKLLFE